MDVFIGTIMIFAGDFNPRGWAFCDGQLIMTIASTKPELHVDIWSGNHPFYTGSQKIIDTEGRVERFLKKYNMESEEENN